MVYVFQQSKKKKKINFFNNKIRNRIYNFQICHYYYRYILNSKYIYNISKHFLWESDNLYELYVVWD